jgi:phage RecT family recombinase
MSNQVSTTKPQVAAQNHLTSLSPLKIADDPKVAEKFMTLYSAIHGANNAKAFYEAEKFNFANVIQDSPDLQACDKMSLYGCFLDVSVNGLSFDTTKKLVYMVAYNQNIGTKEKPQWVKKAKLHISPYGELLIRQRVGQVKHVDNPKLVFKGDVFREITDEHGTKVHHEANHENRNNEIIACFVRIIRPDGSIDFKVLYRDEFENLRKQSKTPDGGSYKNNYAGMFMAKTIKHAFKTYSKVKVGQFSALETAIEEVDEIDYNLDADSGPVNHEAEMEDSEPQIQDAEMMPEEEEEDTF